MLLETTDDLFKARQYVALDKSPIISEPVMYASVAAEATRPTDIKSFAIEMKIEQILSNTNIRAGKSRTQRFFLETKSSFVNWFLTGNR